jgi:hypothetical protein
MGNYNGTVTCGYCYQQGHNKRSCPRATERAQRAYQEAKEAGSSDLEYYAHNLAKRTGINPETGEKRKRRNESYGRKCSYCREQGHSRRTCSSMKDDHRNYRRMAQVVRTDMLARMREHGFGVGSLLTLAGSEWNEEASEYQDVTSAYLVTKIKWEGIGPHNQGGDSCVKVISVKDPSNQPWLAMPDSVSGSADTRYSRTPELVGATPSEKINPPSAWTAGARAEENAGCFEKGQTRDGYWFRTYGAPLLDRWGDHFESTE